MFFFIIKFIFFINKMKLLLIANCIKVPTVKKLVPIICLGFSLPRYSSHRNIRLNTPARLHNNCYA